MIQRVWIYVAILLGLVGVGKWSYAAGQETLNAVAKKSTGDAVTQIREGFNTELAKQQRMNTELYAADLLKANTSAFASQSAFTTAWGWTPGGVSAWSDVQALISGSGDYIKYDGTRGTPTGTITAGPGVLAALANSLDGVDGLASRASIDALPNIVFSTGITVAENTPSAGTDTVSITANTYQAYDADLTTWAAVTPGTGVATAIAANTGAVGGLPTIIASGAYTVDTASISANTCASAVAVTALGVATTDIIIATPSAILSSVAGFGVTTAGAVRVDVYPTSGNVNFQFCNPTGAAIDHGSVTFNWKVIR